MNHLSVAYDQEMNRNIWKVSNTLSQHWIPQKAANIGAQQEEVMTSQFMLLVHQRLGLPLSPSQVEGPVR